MDITERLRKGIEAPISVMGGETFVLATIDVKDAIAEIERLRIALRDLVAAFVNPGDGDVFEAGEVPELDAARAALAHEQSPRPEVP